MFYTLVFRFHFSSLFGSILTFLVKAREGKPTVKMEMQIPRNEATRQQSNRGARTRKGQSERDGGCVNGL